MLSVMIYKYHLPKPMLQVLFRMLQTSQYFLLEKSLSKTHETLSGTPGVHRSVVKCFLKLLCLHRP